MTIHRIRTLGDPVLREPARDVDRFDAALAGLRDDMLETMYDAPGVGLAAPQIGLSLRFFVFDAGDGRGPGAIANPVITLMEGEVEEDEGCLSVPGIYHPTKRAGRVRVEGRDIEGAALILDGVGLPARIFQHETDHLGGILYIDRLDQAGRREVMAAIRDRELAEQGGSGFRVRPRSRPAE
jgi:peptide deformylase